MQKLRNKQKKYTMTIEIRTYKHSTDATAAKSLFVDGLTSVTPKNILQLFNVYMYHPTRIYIMTISTVLLGILIALGYSLLNSVIVVFIVDCAFLLFVLGQLNKVFYGYIRQELETEMCNPEETYVKKYPESNFWVATQSTDGNRVVGSVAVKKANENQMELLRMYVDNTLRRQGIASKLIYTAEQFAKEHGYSEMILHTSSLQWAAHKLYERNGYTQYHIKPASPIAPVSIYSYKKQLTK
jgi:ribosomal protein S18 acetylase RimI-like enzyme